jgi:hypothetical protein
MSLTHRQICHSVAHWLLQQQAIQLVSWELGLPVGVVDVIGITTKTKKYDSKIVVVEVKRSRADLLQDLKKQKMLGYEKQASHCYLAVTQDCVWTPKELSLGAHLKPDAAKTVVAFLQDKGLPAYWGVLLYSPNGGASDWQCIRQARRTATRITSVTLEAITKKIALSFMYRILSPTSPVIELE